MLSGEKMVDKVNFGNIIELPLNKFFQYEDRDFTPWLQENIELLGNIIGIDIEDADTEVSVGNYKLDILAYESGTGRKIAIENQYGATDHKHLGQLITYMAGINAEVVVWLAEDFNKEHISAVNHLNEISNENIAFFCIKPRLIKIGDSAPAIEFVTKAKPDEWEKQVQGDINKPSERGLEYKKFWIDLINRYKEKYPKYKPLRGYQARNSHVLCYSETGIDYSVKFSQGSLFITLWMGPKSKTNPHELVDRIILKKSEIEEKLGSEIIIDKREDVRSTKVFLKCDKETDILDINEEDKDYLMDWVIKWLPKFKKTIEPIINDN